MSPGHHETQSYGGDSWMGMGSYAQPGQPRANATHQDYHNYDYQTSAPMSIEPTYTMSRPPPYATQQHNQMPPPLVTPQHHVWPSMLAGSSSFPQPILPAVPIQTPLSASSMESDLTPTSAKTTTSRRKLTDDERRLMCLEAENNPTMKQTQIGAKFNVERSTVSKILRQKDKYMKQPQPQEEVTSPGKKTKAKLPDVERALSIWARKQQKKGLPITTEELREQVVKFTSGRPDQQIYTSTSWVGKFQKRYLAGDAAIGTREDTAETGTSLSETVDHSPISSNGLVSPPMSAIEDTHQSQRGSGRSDDMFDFEGHDSEALLSPISPEVKQEYVSSNYADDAPTDMNFSRQRSMTLPHLAAPAPNRPASADRSMPSLPVRATSSMIESKHTSIDPRQTMKRHKSVPDIHDTEAVRYSTMQPPPLPRSADISPVSIPNSPSQQDETIRALYNIKRLLEQRPDVAEPDDYVMIGKLMEKLRLLRSPTSTPVLPGGMRPIDMTDSPRLSKKRTVVEMSM